jgi:hypothetical protein
MVSMTIRVFYTCALCGLFDAPVEVPARGDVPGDDDVLVWMRHAIDLVAANHHERSPFCQPDTLTNIKIPVAHADRLGGPSMH